MIHDNTVHDEIATAKMSGPTNEWPTPPALVAEIVQFMGGIDTDPCSNSKQSPNVPATVVFTVEDDGLAHQWFGRVFLNPPYLPSPKAWLDHLLDQYAKRNVTEAVILVFNKTETKWFSAVADLPKVFLRGRLKFGQATNSAPHGSVLIYLGKRVKEFFRQFSPKGWCAEVLANLDVIAQAATPVSATGTPLLQPRAFDRMRGAGLWREVMTRGRVVHINPYRDGGSMSNMAVLLHAEAELT